MQNQTALIVGMAKSGIGAAKLLSRHGWHVIINDMKPEIPGLEEALKGYPCEWRLGEDPLPLIERADLIIPSPIIPMTVPFLSEAKKRGIEIESEIELGYRYAKADFVCITGTNGKTTSTALTGEIFKAGGFRTFVLGNIGIAITEHAEETQPGDIIVAETAALQLEGCSRFHARAAACCNITEDHLDHFGDMGRRGGIDIRGNDAKRLDVLEEGVFVFLCEVIERDLCGTRAADGLVIDIRQIHDMLDVEIEEAESPFEDVFEGIASEIADVGEIIDGGAAGIKADVVVCDGLELLDAVCQGVVE